MTTYTQNLRDGAEERLRGLGIKYEFTGVGTGVCWRDTGVKIYASPATLRKEGFSLSEWALEITK